MEPKLREYIENLFSYAPRTKQTYELKEEIIRNTIERYHDLLDDGKTEGDAYNLAIAGIGDISELLDELGVETYSGKMQNIKNQNPIKSRLTIFRVIAVVLYILSITPIIFFDAIGGNSSFGVCLMFLMISTATGLLIYSRITKLLPFEPDLSKRKQVQNLAILRACAVGGYISCVVPVIFFDAVYLSAVGIILMFVVLAFSTGILILSSIYFSNKKTENTMTETENIEISDNRQIRTKKAYRTLTAILWILTSVLYIFITIYGISTISFMIGFVTWVIFPIAIAMQQLMKAIFDYMEERI